MMAIKGRSAEQQAALAKIVTPDTLDDIEEYIRPRFPPKSESGLSVERSLPSLNLASKRLIVQDGHGRWREVKPQFYSNNLQKDWSPGPVGLNSQHMSLIVDSRFSDRSFQTPGYYNHLSMALRSNVFPGLGNNEWSSTTAKAFTDQTFTSFTQRDKYFGIQTDEYGKWSAANVLHDRMKKKWDDYLNTLPKQAAERTFQKANILTPQMKRPLPPKGKKTHPVKPKMQKKELKKPSSKSSTRLLPKDTTVLPLPPQVDIPVDDNDDNFWDFYDEPFNKPT